MNTIEPLETRIAPASVFNYVDVDGDKVRISSSANGPNIADAVFLFAAGTGMACGGLDLVPAYAGANITFTVTKVPGGDGLAHVGYIDAAGIDLGNVTVKGDLASISAGNGNAADGPALKTLNVRSMGRFGDGTGGGFGSLTSDIQGKLNALVVGGDAVGISFKTTGGIGAVTIKGSLVGGDTGTSGQIFSDLDIGAVKIGGDLIGGDVGLSSGTIQSSANIASVSIGGSIRGGVGALGGSVFAAGTLGPVKIGKSIIGGAGESSGRIACGADGRIVSVLIGGSVVGGAGENSGGIFVGVPGFGGDGSLGNVTIGRSVIGGAGEFSGSLRSPATIANVKIGGDLLGGTNERTGNISGSDAIGNVSIGGDFIGGSASSAGLIVSDALGHVRIGGDFIGGSDTGAAAFSESGLISVEGRIASVTIGGSFVAGTNGGGGLMSRCGAIVADEDIGPVKIGGSIVGNSTNQVLIVADGQPVTQATGFDTAIASLTVGGDVRFARIMAGFTDSLQPINADAAIGAVSVGRNWVASDLVAGAQDTGAAGFGVGDTLQAGGNAALIARIASITIKGEVSGSLAAGDNFGFVAEQIGKLTVGGRTFTLVPGPGSPADNILISFADDMHLLEVP